jgi:hypothetical protein
MLDVMPHIGAAIRQKMNWVPENKIIILIMDSAGGHGTVEAIEQYTRHLLENYRIQITSASKISRNKSSRLGSLEEHSVIGRKKKYHKTTIADALAHQ